MFACPNGTASAAPAYFLSRFHVRFVLNDSQLEYPLTLRDYIAISLLLCLSRRVWTCSGLLHGTDSLTPETRDTTRVASPGRWPHCRGLFRGVEHCTRCVQYFMSIFDNKTQCLAFAFGFVKKKERPNNS